MRILLVGHGCDPYRGSEPGITWNWAWHLSELHEVWLITHPRSRDRITRFLEINKRPTLQIRFVEVPRSSDPWRLGLGIKGLQLSYILWLRRAFREARRLVSRMPFDVVHQVGWGTIAIPSPFWRLGLPFIWGPLGGGQTVPRQFRYLFGGAPVSEWLRDANIASLPFRPEFRKAVQRSSRVFAVNGETSAVVRRAGKPDVEMFLDCGMSGELLQSASKPRRAGDHMTLLWGGTLEPRKGLPLAIEAMAALPPSSDARLIVAGDGPCRTACQALCEKLGVTNRVDFLGTVPLARIYELMAACDAFLFTSVRDTFGSILLEAAAHRLPIIALNHQGAATWLPDDAGIKVPVTDPASTVRSLAAAIERLERDPDMRQELGNAGYTFACRNTWQERARRMTAVYSEAMNASFAVGNAVREPGI